MFQYVTFNFILCFQSYISLSQVFKFPFYFHVSKPTFQAYRSFYILDSYWVASSFGLVIEYNLVSISTCKIQCRFGKIFQKLEEPCSILHFCPTFQPMFRPCFTVWNQNKILLIRLSRAKMWPSQIHVGFRSWVLGVLNSFMFWLQVVLLHILVIP